MSEELISDLTLKAVPVVTDEIEIQETAAGASFKATLDTIPYGTTIQAGIATDTAVVHITGTETVTGVKTLTKPLSTANATAALGLATKQQMDAADALKVGLADQNNFTARQTWQFGADIASAATVTLGTDGNSFHLTGTTTIADFTAITGSGPVFLITDSSLTFTHAAGVLETNTGADITAAAGDRFRLDQDSDGTTWLLTHLSGNKRFTSSEQTITAAGLLTMSHGLGSTPYKITVWAICKTAENGYSVGDETRVEETSSARDPTVSTSNQGMSIVPDATNLTVRLGDFSSPVRITHKTTGASLSATNANWKLIFRAEL